MNVPAVLYILVIVIKEVFTVSKRKVFTIHTEGCTIAAFPEVSESIKNIVTPPQITKTCGDVTRLVTSNSSHIWVIEEALELFQVFRVETFFCCYRHFSAHNNIGNIIYSDCIEFSKVIKVQDEYVQIECYHMDNKIYEDYFLFSSHETIVPTHYNKESYNVLILGIESMSRLNFHRTMPLTAQFLENRGFIELLGYNKLGDNSYPNLFPTLTGLSFENAKQVCIHNDIINFEECVFIWDKFKEYGYHTALGSDSIAGLLGTYEYTLPTIPTQSYLQPFIFETRKLFRNQRYNFHQCMGSEFYFDILLNYIYSLTHVFKMNRLFGMFWEESISHEDLNAPHIMDASYYNFLINLEKENYLNDTILIFLSDHGMRWGKIVHTEQGRLEERLPLLGILFPEHFKKTYKLAYKNIQQNADRLTTPFDIHETLLDLLKPSSLSDSSLKKRYESLEKNLAKSSLFLPVSAQRNCSSVGIEEHWCACRRGKKIKIGSKLKTIAAQHLVEHLNQLLNGYSQCQKLNVMLIYDVSLVETNKQWRTYTVMIKTTPGEAIFDGTLVRGKTSWIVSGTVSRLNRYFNQSDCVDDATVKLYCYCG